MSDSRMEDYGSTIEFDCGRESGKEGDDFVIFEVDSESKFAIWTSYFHEDSHTTTDVAMTFTTEEAIAIRDLINKALEG